LTDLLVKVTSPARDEISAKDGQLDQWLETKLALNKKLPDMPTNKELIDMERERERERILREREKAAAQVSSKKKVEQRISTMTEAQIMEKLRKFC
jgi:protein-serine/threonine kinase